MDGSLTLRYLYVNIMLLQLFNGRSFRAARATTEQVIMSAIRSGMLFWSVANGLSFAFVPVELQAVVRVVQHPFGYFPPVLSVPFFNSSGWFVLCDFSFDCTVRFACPVDTSGHRWTPVDTGAHQCAPVDTCVMSEEDTVDPLVVKIPLALLG
jgi:hypothetical protein